MRFLDTLGSESPRIPQRNAPLDAFGRGRIGGNRPFNQGVAGSIPARPTNRINNLRAFRGPPSPSQGPNRVHSARPKFHEVCGTLATSRSSPAAPVGAREERFPGNQGLYGRKPSSRRATPASSHRSTRLGTYRAAAARPDHVPRLSPRDSSLETVSLWENRWSAPGRPRAGGIAGDRQVRVQFDDEKSRIAAAIEERLRSIGRWVS